MGIGHSCSGGGAHISNSPIHIHIHIHGGAESLTQKVTEALYGIIGHRNMAIDGTVSLVADNLQGRDVREVEHG